MKKSILCFLLVSVLCVCVSCKKNSEGGKSQNLKTKDKIDLDFTKYNYNIASGLIFDILVDQDKYIGKKMKIGGQFFSNYDEVNKLRHYSVLFYDPTACCQTGLQFMLKGNPVYPQDFPAEMADCSVTGILCCKELNGMDYLYLECDSIDLVIPE